MAAVWLGAGIVEPHLPHAGQSFNVVGVIQTLVFSFLLFGWCRTHAESHNITMPTGAAAFSALLPPFGVPYYLLRGFGWRKGSLLVLLAAGLLVGFVLLYVVSFVVSARVGI